MQKVGVFRKISDVGLVGSDQRMFKRNVNGAITVLNIKDHRITAGLAPALDDLDAAVASSHQSSQIDGAHFKVFWNRDGLFHDWRVQNPGNCKFLSGLQEGPVNVRICSPECLRQLRGSEIRTLRKI